MIYATKRIHLKQSKTIKIPEIALNTNKDAVYSQTG